MFLGEYTHTLDDKGRLTIPAKFRSDLAAGVVITRGFDQNLVIYSADGWRQLAEQVAQRPLSDESTRAFRRRLFSGAVDLSLDKQGRIIVPPYLREFATIESDVVIAGMFNFIEVWSTSAWQTVRESIEKSDDSHRWDSLGF